MKLFIVKLIIFVLKVNIKNCLSRQRRQRYYNYTSKRFAKQPFVKDF